MKQKNIFKKLLTLVLLLVASTTGAWGQGNEYQLVTDASTLADGDVIIIASSANDGNHYAMGGANTANNRKAVLVSVSSSTITTSVSNGDETVSNANTANASLTKPFEVTLVKSGDNWNLKEVLSDGNVYLNGGYGKTQGASSNNNHLKAAEDVVTTTGKVNNGVYSIEINSTTHVATIENQNGWSIRINGSIFSTYETGQNDVFIYKKAAPSTNPSILASNVNIEYNATAGTIESTINNPVAGGALTAAKKTTADWLTLGSVSGTNVPFTTTANDGSEDRVATVTLTYTYNTSETVTKDVTITQGHYIKDYVDLPFNWAGGASADFKALTGVSTDGLGTDYGASNSPYLIKLDSDNDYIQFKTNEQPGTIDIGVKMIGGANTSKITVKESADGSTFTDVEELTISGSQNDIVNLETTMDFNPASRYVRLVFKKGSNVGVGPISIASAVVKTATTTTIDASGITNTDLDTSTAAGQLTASVTAGGTPVGGATVTWTSSDEDVATIDTEGNVTLKKNGTTTITASYAGDATYASSADTYELTVTSSAQVMNVSIDLTNTFWGQAVHTSGDATEDLVFTGSKENIIVTYYVPEGSHYYFNTSNTRVYDTDDIQVDAPAGYVLETITFTSDGSYWNDATPTTGAMSTSNSKLWEGPANTVRFHWNVTGTRIKTIVVTLKEGATVSDAKWATYVTPKDIDFAASTGVTAYKVTGADGKIELEEVDAAPKGTPLVIAANEDTYVLTVAASAPAAVTGNLLKAADGTQTGDGTGNFYVLGKDNQGKVGFGPLGNGVTLAVGKAYIDGTEVTAKGFLPFVIGDEENETTSIKAVETAEVSGTVYNLAGQKVSKGYKGIVIVNGKKFVRK